MAKIDRVQEVSIDLLRPYERNAKIHGEEQVKQIAESIKEFGFISPCLIDKDYNIIAGHGRVMASKLLGLQKVPCLFIEGLTDTQRRAYILADNRLTELGEWDFDKVQFELHELADMDFNIDLTGFELEEFKDSKEIVEDDYTEENIEPRAKLGDLYQLGNHRLICGDSTDVSVIDRLMDGVKAKLLLTDPPYGIDVVKGNKVGGDKSFGKVGGGNIVKSKTYSAIIGDDTTDTARANYDVALTCTENQIIFGGNYFTDFLQPSRCWIVWDKQNTGNFADAELAWTSFDKGVRLYHFLWNGLCREGSREVEGKTRVHPTQKPVGMLADILKDFSEENDGILDCFGGSGSTLIACEQLNRKCYMVELDEHYCDVIIDRWENFTGKKAVKI
jgi:DNA modification methylase